jgi:hypothetical protein
VNHRGMALRGLCVPWTLTAQDRKAAGQPRSPRQTSTIRRGLAVTLTATG